MTTTTPVGVSTPICTAIPCRSYSTLIPEFSDYLRVFPAYSEVPDRFRDGKRWLLYGVHGTAGTKPSKALKGSTIKETDWDSFDVRLREFATLVSTSVNATFNIQTPSGGWKKLEGKYAGLGCVVNWKDSFHFADCDDCVQGWNGETGIINKETAEVILLGDGLAELSVSGTGIHIYVENRELKDYTEKRLGFSATQSQGSNPSKNPWEYYVGKRYFAMTGVWVKVKANGDGTYSVHRTYREPSIPLPDGSKLLPAIWDKIDPERKKSTTVTTQNTQSKTAQSKTAQSKNAQSKNAGTAGAGNARNNPAPRDQWPAPSAVIHLIRNNSDALAAWEGVKDFRKADGTYDTSAAAASLFEYVAFYCGAARDTDLIFNVFSQSPFEQRTHYLSNKARDKAYLKNNVLPRVSKFYEPPRKTIVDAQTGEVVDDVRPVVRFVKGTGSTIECANQLCRITKQARLVYLYGERLSVISRRFASKNVTDIGKSYPLPTNNKIVPLDIATATSIATVACRWETLIKGEWEETNPAQHIVQHFMTTGAETGNFPELTALINCPNMRHDGTIVSEQGYDEKTGMYADFGGQAFRSVPDKPNFDEIAEAKGILNETFAEFLFDDDHGVSKSVAYAGLLTAVSKNAVGTYPLFVVSSPNSGSGKSTLVDVWGVALTGREAPAGGLSERQEEQQKQMLSILSEGWSIYNIDNVNGELESPELCKAITQGEYTGRPLGETKTRTVKTNTLFTITGINVKLKNDLTRRTMLSVLNCKKERAYDREFKKVNLIQWAKENRSSIVWAALVILKAGFDHKDKPLAPYGGYEEWNSLVSRAVQYVLELPDPRLSQKRIEDEDPDLQRRSELLHAWHDCKELQGPVYLSKIGDAMFTNRELREAMETACPVIGRGGWSAGKAKFEQWCGTNKDRPVNGLVLHRINRGKYGFRWEVTEMPE